MTTAARLLKVHHNDVAVFSEQNQIVLNWDSCPPADHEGVANQTIKVQPNTAADYVVVSENFLVENGNYSGANTRVSPNFYQCILNLEVKLKIILRVDPCLLALIKVYFERNATHSLLCEGHNETKQSMTWFIIVCKA